jgi:riboflavin kinase / FMN adenylyltransferase
MSFNICYIEGVICYNSQMDIHLTISGQVIHGKKRGKALGYPTANFVLTEHVEEGIYVSEARIGSIRDKGEIGEIGSSGGLGEWKWLPSVTFVGAAETFGEHDVKVETYILDFDEDIYGKKLNVKLIKKIRDNEKFVSVEELVSQIGCDIDITRKYFDK